MESKDEMEQINDNDVVERLIGMFGSVLSNDVIIAVVESCGGDINQSIEGIMDIAGDVPTSQVPDASGEFSNNPQSPNPKNSHCPKDAIGKSETNESDVKQESASQQIYTAVLPPDQADASQASGSTLKNYRPPFWNPQVGRVFSYLDQECKVMVIMRGVPGSGKSYLANQIVELMIGFNMAKYESAIFSTDEYFIDNKGVYIHHKARLSDAHLWNQQRVRMAANKGIPLIIVDNTNIKLWEMEPYVRLAVNCGYIIEVMEPDTRWAKRATDLYERNVHNVPFLQIQRMLDNFDGGLTGDKIMKCLRIHYSPSNVPPVLQNKHFSSFDFKSFPNYIPKEFTTNKAQSKIGDRTIAIENSRAKNDLIPYMSNLNLGQSSQIPNENAAVFPKSEVNTSLTFRITEEPDNELENGCDNENPITNSDGEIQKQPKDMHESPNPNKSADTEGLTNTISLMETVNTCQDWSSISMFMPAWTESVPSTSSNAPPIPVETVSSSTCMEIGDTSISNTNTHKVISAASRDINMFYVSTGNKKIPDKQMLDKGTSTNEQLITETQRCKNEEKHFIAFRKLFKNISKASLRDIFDQCCGDVNWAVDIVFDCIGSKKIPTLETDELSEEEEEIIEPCACLAAYDIIPDTSTNTTTINKKIVTETAEAVPQLQKKAKKELTLSETTLQIKRQIEKNVVIAEDHYSNHCLKIRQMYRGENTENYEQPGTSRYTEDTSNDSCVLVDQLYDEESDDEECSNDVEDEKIVSVYLGQDFIKQLDSLFGRRDFEYSDAVIPKISIPMSMLNELNALWIESVMNQLEKEAKQSESLVKQDEEFARELAAKEEAMAQAGIEPPVPDFKEIMDMELAVALYQKDVAEWRKQEPTDLAAKLTRDKLYFLFPEVPRDTLAELLVAHGYNFYDTVEGLLVSTGREEILEDKKNGVNRFILKKEIERKTKVLTDEREALSEAQWPYLPNKGERVDMETVKSYREKAQKHLLRRNLYFNKAKEFISRGLTQVASYYSDIASFHKQRFDYENHLAAASLMQYHAAGSKDCETIDLHYMRVSEAKQSLDMFIDAHIENLRSVQRERSRSIYIITGRGLHSIGGPRIKPAVVKQLTERGLTFQERNPGLLSAKLTAEDRFTNDIP